MLKKKVLLVYPKTPTTYWSFDHALPFIGRKAALPPLGLLTVAAMLPAGFEVRLVDLNVRPLEQAELEWCDLVFLSAMIVQQKSFAEVVRFAQDCGKTVVAGGPYAISSWQEIEGVDHFVLGEVELTLPRFLADLEAGRPQRVYHEEGKPDLSLAPVPRFELIDPGDYDSMPLQYSRGCPYSCEFCDIIELFGRRQRTKRPQQFLREMDAVLATGFRGPLFIVDDNFVGNHRLSKELLRAVVGWQREHGFPFTLATEASIDLARDEELLGLMGEAGFTMVFVGIETPDAATLAHTGKGQNLKGSILESVERLQHAGLEVTGGFIVGFDTDPPDIFERQIRFIEEAGIPAAMVGLLTALPGTQLGRRLAREGRMRGAASGNNTHLLATNFEPRMPERTLIEGYKRVLAELYDPPRYFERCLTLLRRLPRRSHGARSYSGTEVRAFLRSLLKQGLSSYGLAYLRFLATALLLRPGLFPDAVASAIKGHHFFTITAEIMQADAFSLQLRQAHHALQPRVAEAARGRKREVAEVVQRLILRLQGRLRKRYAGFSEGLRQHLQEAFTEFDRNCRRWLSELFPG